jgi:hypothetical protein
VQLALKDFQIAQMQKAAADQALQNSQQAVMAKVAEIKKEMALDDSWDFNFQTLTWFKKPEPPKAEKK